MDVLKVQLVIILEVRLLNVLIVLLEHIQVPDHHHVLHALQELIQTEYIHLVFHVVLEHILHKTHQIVRIVP